MPEQNSAFLVSSIYGAKTKKGLVDIKFQNINTDEPLTIEPNNAREVANNLIQAAEAAEQDEFLVNFLTNNVGMPVEEAVVVLLEPRKCSDGNRESHAHLEGLRI